MKKHSRALRWCALGLCLITIWWGTVSFIETLQITQLNREAAKIIYSHSLRNEFGHYNWRHK